MVLRTPRPNGSENNYFIVRDHHVIFGLDQHGIEVVFCEMGSSVQYVGEKPYAKNMLPLSPSRHVIRGLTYLLGVILKK